MCSAFQVLKVAGLSLTKPTLGNHTSRPGEYKNRIYTSHVTKVSGQMPRFFQSHDWIVEYSWKFKIDASLHMNFTFFSIFFSRADFTTCRWGFVEIQNKMNGKLVYCKEYSTFSAYPAGSFLSVILNVCTSTIYKFNLTFTVMDKDFVRSLEFEDFQMISSQSLTNFHRFIFCNRIPFIAFKIVVERLSTMKIDLTRERNVKIILFDGPGVLSKKKRIESGDVETTSFQCVVQALQNFASLNLYFAQQKRHSTLKLSVLHQTTNTSVVLPNTECFQIICVLGVVTSEGFSINLTIFSFFFTGYSSLECTFGGLLIRNLADENGNHMGLPLCETDLSNRRTFYSQSSSLSVVMYWFEPYITVNATITLSRTKCRGVPIDNCQIINVCESDRYYINYAEICHQYLHNLTRFAPHLNLTFARKHEHQYWPSLQFSLEDTACVVFEFKFHKLPCDEYDCQVDACTLSLWTNKSTSQSLSEISLEVTGSFFPQHSERQKGWVYADCIDVYGPVKKFEFLELNNRMQKHSEIETYVDGVELLENYHRKLDIYSSISITSPLQTDIFEIWFQFRFFSKSWFNTVVQQIPLTTAFQNSSSISISALSLFDPWDVKNILNIPSSVDFLMIQWKSNKCKNITKTNLFQIDIVSDKGQVQKEFEFLYWKTGKPNRYNCAFCHTALFWSQVIFLSRLRKERYISVPGTMHRITVTKKTQYCPVIATLDVFWVPHRYAQKNIILRNIQCTTVLDSSKYSCYQISQGQQHKFSLVVEWEIFQAKQKDQSGEEATTLCRWVNASLPFVSSRRFQNELMALFKTATHIPLLEAIFIGPKLVRSGKVSYFSLFPQEKIN